MDLNNSSVHRKDAKSAEERLYKIIEDTYEIAFGNETIMVL